MATPPLTRRQRQILDFFQAYISEHGISPTLEEVAQEFGVNKVTIFGHVSELERKGVLTRAAKGISRGLQLVQDESGNTVENPRASSEASIAAGHSSQPSDGQNAFTGATGSGKVLSSVPIMGRIAAGAPIDVVADPENLDLQDLVPDDREVYALRVAGTSMIDDGIRDGDLVLVENRNEAQDGEMVVAITPDEEATLKRIYREDGRIRLQPANAEMEPIYVPDCEVRGVVIGVVRRF